MEQLQEVVGGSVNVYRMYSLGYWHDEKMYVEQQAWLRDSTDVDGIIGEVRDYSPDNDTEVWLDSQRSVTLRKLDGEMPTITVSLPEGELKWELRKGDHRSLGRASVIIGDKRLILIRCYKGAMLACHPDSWEEDGEGQYLYLKWLKSEKLVEQFRERDFHQTDLSAELFDHPLLTPAQGKSRREGGEIRPLWRLGPGWYEMIKSKKKDDDRVRKYKALLRESDELLDKANYRLRDLYGKIIGEEPRPYNGPPYFYRESYSESSDESAETWM